VARVGLIGLGAIGEAVLEARAKGELPGVEIVAVLVRRPRPQARRGDTEITANPAHFFSHPMDAVLECAGHQAVRDHAERAIAAGANLMVTSVGAFTDEPFFKRVIEAARLARRRVILPSAGIGALDILSAGAAGGLEEVEIEVRKDAASWKGTAAERSHDLDRLKMPVVLFDGPVREGAKRYPQNVNISAAVALAGIGLDKTRLRIVADPTIDTHLVTVSARGAFGEFRFVEDVIPSAQNRKTGKLVAMAVVKTLRQLESTLVVGA
jgi:aspartate dehydrogenase